MLAHPRALLEEISSRSEFADRETVVRPLRVVYADHSRLGHHGVATGDVIVVLMRAFKLVCRGFRFLECVKFPPWGRISAPASVAPEALEECLHSSKGYKYRPAWLTDWGDCSSSFLAGIGVPFSRPQHFSRWGSDP